MLPPQNLIDESMIPPLVRTFYERARLDPLLAPVFESRVHDWDAHLATMCDFWSSVTLATRRYHGPAMALHAVLPIEAAHFDRWLELFSAAAADTCPPPAAADTCPPPAAAVFIDAARRIAATLLTGIRATAAS